MDINNRFGALNIFRLTFFLYGYRGGGGEQWYTVAVVLLFKILNLG